MIFTHLVISSQWFWKCRRDQIKNIRLVFPVQLTSLSVCWCFWLLEVVSSADSGSTSLSLCRWCCRRTAILDPKPYWSFSPLGREPQRHVQPQRWVLCPHPGPILHSGAAGGRWSGRADQPSCGACAAGGTSSSDPWRGRLGWEADTPVSQHTVAQQHKAAT